MSTVRKCQHLETVYNGVVPRGVILLASLVRLAALVSAQEINVANGLVSRQPALTIFDEIDDPAERRAFRGLWDAPPRSQIDLAGRFVDRYPRSLVLREAYELAARAYVAEGDLAQGFAWGMRALRLMPENPSLLVMVADTAAKRGELEVAAASAPLLASLTLNPGDMEALYTIAVVRMAVRTDDGAARAFAHVAQSGCRRRSRGRRFIATGVIARRRSSARRSHARSASARATRPAGRATIRIRRMPRRIRPRSNSAQTPTACACSATPRSAIAPSGTRGTPPAQKPANACRATCRGLWKPCCFRRARIKSMIFLVQT